MTAMRWLALAALIAALLAVQHGGLQKEPEYEREQALSNVGDLPARDMIPTYVASLFLGAFRAVAIDVLWIRLKEVEEQRRWFERREILKMISYFQPRNPEVWAHLGWHSAYNVANGFADPAKGWEWVVFGLEWLRDGVKRLPDAVYLKFEIARTLTHKPTWKAGQLDADFLARIEKDADLQRKLMPKGMDPPEKPLTAFELAILWMERARDQIHARGDKGEKTQVGLYIYKDTIDGFIREALYFQGIYRLQQGDVEDAKRWFLRASEHVKEMLEKQKEYYGHPISDLHVYYVDFYAGLARVVDLREKEKDGGLPEKRAYGDALKKLIIGDERVGLLDQGFLWRPLDPTAPLNRIRSELTNDPHECNDVRKLATPIMADRDYTANLEPKETDVDVYQLELAKPEGHKDHDHQATGPEKPLPLSLKVTRPEGAGGGIRVTVVDPLFREVRNVEIRDRSREISFEADRYGPYRIWVRPIDLTGSSDYGFRLTIKRE